MSDSESISNRVRSLYGEYKKIATTPTDKQLELIKKIDPSVTPTSTVFEAQKQIRFLIGNQKISSGQQKLMYFIPKTQIDTILRRDVVIEDMTHFEMTRVMNTLDNTIHPTIYNHPTISTSTYEYGWQESNKCPEGKLYYIVYYDLLMVDIDSVAININTITECLNILKLTGRLYRTYNGYHIFITSQPINHKSSEAKYIMEALQCDLFYITFSYLNGFKVRLNPKLRDDEIVAAEYIATIGNGNENEDPQLVTLLLLHDDYILQHKKTVVLNDDSSGITKMC